MQLNITKAVTVQCSPNMRLHFWTVLTAILLTSSSATPLQNENLLLPSATANITTLKKPEYVLGRPP